MRKIKRWKKVIVAFAPEISYFHWPFGLKWAVFLLERGDVALQMVENIIFYHNLLKQGKNSTNLSKVQRGKVEKAAFGHLA